MDELKIGDGENIRYLQRFKHKDVFHSLSNLLQMSSSSEDFACRASLWMVKK